MFTVTIIMVIANILMFISVMLMNKARKEAVKEAVKEHDAWGDFMYTKGYNDCLNGKIFNPQKNYKDIIGTLLQKYKEWTMLQK